jgi:hypothetical protein
MSIDSLTPSPRKGAAIVIELTLRGALEVPM